MVAAAGLLAVATFVAGRSVAPSPDARVLQLDVDFGGDLAPQTDIALPRDGERVAFIGRDREGRNHLVTRRFDDGQATRLRDVGERFGTPFFSFDARSIAWVDGRRLLRVPVEGGPVTTIAEPVANPGGGGR